VTALGNRLINFKIIPKSIHNFNYNNEQLLNLFVVVTQIRTGLLGQPKNRTLKIKISNILWLKRTHRDECGKKVNFEREWELKCVTNSNLTFNI